MTRRPHSSAPLPNQPGSFGEGVIVGALLCALLTGILILLTGWAQS